MSDQQQQQQKKKKPSFEGNDMPMNISRTNDDHIGEETTRRIGGTAIMPSFQPISFGAPPAMGAPQFQNTLQQKQPALTQQSYPSATAVATAAAAATPTGSSWRLNSVPTLPEYHPLERTAVFVPHAARDPSQVTARISEVLRDRSIEAHYSSEGDDKAKVKGVTPDGVDFRVRLYRGRAPSHSHGIIVEVQRRFGSSVNFYRETTAILDAAQGRAVPPPPPSALGSSAGTALPLVSDSEDEYAPSGTSSLDMVAKMFQHSGYDSHHLAYQTLLPLTDASKMGLATARAVSTELLREDNAVGRHVLGLVLNGGSDKNDEDVFKLRTTAMTVLANSLQATKGKIDLSLREELRPVLISELYDRSESNPRSAQMAAQCIEYLLEDDHDAAGFHDALEKGLEVGTARHAGLQRQARRSLDRLLQQAS